MGLNVFTVFGALVTLVTQAPAFEKDVQSVLSDQSFESALASAPLLKAAIATASAQWRQVEGDEVAAKNDKNFFSKISAVEKLLKDAGYLKATVANGRADAALVAEVEASPEIGAKLAAIEAEWVALSGALGAF
jgi:hypothetical protein